MARPVSASQSILVATAEVLANTHKPNEDSLHAYLEACSESATGKGALKTPATLSICTYLQTTSPDDDFLEKLLPALTASLNAWEEHGHAKGALLSVLQALNRVLPRLKAAQQTRISTASCQLLKRVLSRRSQKSTPDMAAAQADVTHATELPLLPEDAVALLSALLDDFASEDALSLAVAVRLIEIADGSLDAQLVQKLHCISIRHLTDALMCFTSGSGIPLVPSVKTAGALATATALLLSAESDMQEPLCDVLDLLLDLLDASLALLAQLPAGGKASAKGQAVALALVGHIHDLLTRAHGEVPADGLARLQAALLSSASTHDLLASTSGRLAEESKVSARISVALSAGLAKSWKAGDRLASEAAFVPFADINAGDGTILPAEQQAVWLLLGRLAEQLRGDEAFLRLVLPLLADRSLMGTPADVVACACFVLADVAATAAVGGQRWAYEQISEVLIKSYKSCEGNIATALLHCKSGAGRPGALAEALRRLALGLSDAPTNIRLDYELRLLALFADVGLVAKSEAHLKDLGGLLPAVADAWHEGRPSGARALMSSASMGFDTLQQHRNLDARLVKAYRLLWIYVAIHELARTTHIKTHNRQWPAEWHDAAVRIATGPTPLLVVGGEMDVDQVEAGLNERVQRLSSSMSPLRLAHKLLEGVKSGQVPAAGLVTSAGHPARNAHLLSTLTLNILRVEGWHQAGNSDVCPLAPLLATQQVATKKDWEVPWLGAMTERVFNVYLDRLCAAAVDAEGEEAELIRRSQMAMAKTLVQALSYRGGHKQARDVADKLLERLLTRCRALLWNPELLEEMLAALDAKDISGYEMPADTRLIGWIRKVVERASLAAPSLAEAVLQELLLRPGDAATGAQQLAAELMNINQQARRRGELALLEGQPAGVVALNRKAQYGGIVLGLQEIFQDQGREGTDIPGVLAQQLRDATTAADYDKRLPDRFLAASAGLGLHPASPHRHDLLRLLCTVPAQRLSPKMLHRAVFSWNWIAIAAPSLQVALLSEVVSAWSATVDARKGLFDSTYDWEAVASSTASNTQTADPLADDAAVDDIILATDSLAAHHCWLSFLLEAWQVWGLGLGPNSAAAMHIFERWAQTSLHRPRDISQHPTAFGARFRMLLLALRYARHMQALEPGQLTTNLLYERILQTALDGFSSPCAWFSLPSQVASREEVAAVRDFAAELDMSDSWPPLGSTPGFFEANSTTSSSSSTARLQLLKALLKLEAERLQVWAEPLSATSQAPSLPNKASSWKTYAHTAWNTSPHLALCLVDRYPRALMLCKEVEALVMANAASVQLQALPSAAVVLAAATSDAAILTQLQRWAPAHFLQALTMLAGAQGQHPAVRAYALRSLHTCPPEQVAFFLPQLVQLLRADENGMIEAFLLDSAGRSIIFAHHLVCTLKAEGTPPQEAFNPTVKRSGWKAPQDTGLWKTADSVCQRVLESLPQGILEYLQAELQFFDKVTDVSGKLYAVPKDERKAAAVQLVKQIKAPRTDLYLPTNPSSRVVAAIPASATPMQSAAKVPILVAFKVKDTQLIPHQERVQACIFKVGDDCRQDVLALQVIGLLKDVFEKAGLGLYLAPYGVLPTAYECGIIEVVPNSQSRSALGETSDGGLYEIWCREFGAPGTERFEAARRNFILSEAGYAVACFLLQAKDRHNGNILVDNDGHLVHIDFGFILEISPGGNLGFESAAFKLSHEMTQLLDPSGRKESPEFHLFQELSIRGYLAARTVAESIIATVSLMSASDLPCYSRGAPLANLRKRFHLEMSDAQAAAFMRKAINNAYDNFRTGFYDYVQHLQQNIPK